MRISILGATGSIGQSALDVISRDRRAWDIVALTGGHNIAQLAADARRFGAQIAVTAYPEQLDALRRALSGSGIEAAGGRAALIEAASRPADIVVNAIIGAAGLAPGLAALRPGQRLALANKESLVAAGALLLARAAEQGAEIIPVDSEHSAIFQALGGRADASSLKSVDHVTITASGGAFRDWPLEDLADATVSEASQHPNWAMGQRITIDSASMFNKALEVIEAQVFFGFKPDQIKVLIHPESIVHAYVTHVDGGSIAHMGPPDMRHAIAYAMHFPHRLPVALEPLNLAAAGRLSFSEPDLARWPALGLAWDVMAAGGAAGAVFNAAKEVALDGFIAGELKFTQMAGVVAESLSRLTVQPGFAQAPASLEDVTYWDDAARAQARLRIAEISNA